MFNLKLKNTLLFSLPFSLFALSQAQAAPAVIEPLTQPPIVIAPYAVSNTDLYSGESKAYRPWFENGAFTGDIIEYDISSGGDLSTDVVLPKAATAEIPATGSTPLVPATSASPATATGSNWSARVQFDAKADTYWNTRKIIFHDGANQTGFRWSNLSGSQQTAMENENKLKYVRGDDANEGTFRVRANLLGDIIHSNPVYIAAPDSTFDLPDYGAFKTTHNNRAKRVYVGANDGMLHVFEADGGNAGNEVYAYIPSMLISNLKNLTKTSFTHTYYVDGQLAEGDAYYSSAWHSLLVGGMGSGAKGLFALDITNPHFAGNDDDSTDAIDQKILWEINGSNSDIGYIHGKSQVARMPSDYNSNEWLVINGNGYASTDSYAKLLLISMDGSVESVQAGTATSNGLSAPALVDIDGDSAVDIAYAGDLQGDLWMFDFRGAANAEAVSVTLLFDGTSDKPITAAPEIQDHPTRGRLVYFGTGSLLSDDDSSNTTTQSIYAVWDDAPSGTTLLTQELKLATYAATDGTEQFTRIVTNDPINWSDHNGWQVDLSVGTGERLLTKPIMRANRLQFVTHVTDDSEKNGKAWLIQLNYLNGGSGENVFLDINGDSNLNPADLTTDDNIPVGIDLGLGSFSHPTITRIDFDDDATFINALIFDIETSTPCVVDCEAGFLNGHIDVDTDSPLGPNQATRSQDYSCYPGGDRTLSAIANKVRDENGQFESWLSIDGLGGEVDAHQHEYDKGHGEVFVDYINLEPRCGQSKSIGSGSNSTQKLERISEVEMPSDIKFFAIIANADLTPYSTFKLNTVEWNVMEYQVLIEKKLAAWKLAGENTTGEFSFDNMMKDDNNNTLLHKYDDFFNGSGVLTGELRHSFNEEALGNGGIISTKYSCVTNDAERNFSESTTTSTNCGWVQTGTGWSGWEYVCDDPVDITTYNTGRWRGGALVTQLIRADQYVLNTDLVIKQTLSDLYRKRTYENASGTDVEVILKDGVNHYAGLRARNKNDDGTDLDPANPAFLYEGVLYWHNQDDICYGDSNWSSDLSSLDKNSSDDEIDNFSITISSLEYDLEKIDARLEELLAIPLEDRTNEEKEEILDKLRIKELLELRISSLQAKVQILDYTGNIKIKQEIELNLSPSLGPNFRTGRRTWIDFEP